MSTNALIMNDVSLIRVTDDIEKHISIRKDMGIGVIAAAIDTICKFMELDDPSLLNSAHYSRNSIAPNPELCFVALYKKEIIGIKDVWLIINNMGWQVKKDFGFIGSKL